MGISKLLVFLIGIHFSSGKIDTIDVENNGLASGKLFIMFLSILKTFLVIRYNIKFFNIPNCKYYSTIRYRQ